MGPGPSRARRRARRPLARADLARRAARRRRHLVTPSPRARRRGTTQPSPAGNETETTPMRYAVLHTIKTPTGTRHTARLLIDDVPEKNPRRRRHRNPHTRRPRRRLHRSRHPLGQPHHPPRRPHRLAQRNRTHRHRPPHHLGRTPSRHPTRTHRHHPPPHHRNPTAHPQNLNRPRGQLRPTRNPPEGPPSGSRSGSLPQGPPPGPADTGGGRAPWAQARPGPTLEHDPHRHGEQHPATSSPEPPPAGTPICWAGPQP